MPNHLKHRFKLFPKSRPKTNQISNNSKCNSSIQHTTSQLTTKIIISHKNSIEA